MRVFAGLRRWRRRDTHGRRGRRRDRGGRSRRRRTVRRTLLRADRVGTSPRRELVSIVALDLRERLLERRLLLREIGDHLRLLRASPAQLTALALQRVGCVHIVVEERLRSLARPGDQLRMAGRFHRVGDVEQRREALRARLVEAHGGGLRHGVQRLCAPAGFGQLRVERAHLSIEHSGLSLGCEVAVADGIDAVSQCERRISGRARGGHGNTHEQRDDRQRCQ